MPIADATVLSGHAPSSARASRSSSNAGSELLVALIKATFTMPPLWLAGCLQQFIAKHACRGRRPLTRAAASESCRCTPGNSPTDFHPQQPLSIAGIRHDRPLPLCSLLAARTQALTALRSSGQTCPAWRSCHAGHGLLPLSEAVVVESFDAATRRRLPDSRRVMAAKKSRSRLPPRVSPAAHRRRLYCSTPKPPGPPALIPVRIATPDCRCKWARSARRSLTPIRQSNDEMCDPTPPMLPPFLATDYCLRSGKKCPRILFCSLTDVKCFASF